MNEIMVVIETEINPTENPEKVKRAVENIFGAVKFEGSTEKQGARLVARTQGREGLTKLYNLFRRERIRDAARKVLFEGLENNSITFYLNKQVAYAGHVSFSEPMGESPLGPIKVKITCNNPKEIIDWLAPRTT
ncbi:MAG: RNA-binding domain-containing protein [Candidatus Bathyarchaeales archaeon]